MTTLHDQWTALYTAGRVRWMAGMMTQHGRVIEVGLISMAGQFPVFIHGHGRRFFHRSGPRALRPDFTDPATIGCLLHQAREAWGDMTAHIHGCLWDMNGDVVPPQWTIIGVTPPVGQSVVGWHLTEPEAILAAIAAAPPKVNP